MKLSNYLIAAGLDVVVALLSVLGFVMIGWATVVLFIPMGMLLYVAYKAML